ncbi:MULTISPECIES: type II toxin-antitoxin system HicB family antitoxin [unclassified Nostoc]|uniref:type II toxin-antitoxin system HicB family antitoxin n=1 Tax=unclassified Nostoc TaxID=2593658 RepID=UPI0025AAE977|nr:MULTISPECIES: type II toxin-antitoxin system HicB family antitoxin [unclassified Nostoc]MDM9582645.1 type II toxin-antitoxin system HicB family antitoxin [Nostoc sp. GT001]MDZ7943964.1 type II toxin-antitoxin system HicB family antitoxin [Nostoc sp. EfeVER01]MDZ7992315.1 type II toxin-antitoxin system HicB family antitoxin [Nostoc sp. EspVER01]
MDFYTTVLRKSAGYWFALCLENGLVRQGINQAAAIKQLKEAIASFLEVYKIEPNMYHPALTIKELHEFLSVDDTELG